MRKLAVAVQDVSDNIAYPCGNRIAVKSTL